MENYKYCVIRINGTYAGRLCLTLEEARELVAHHNGSSIMKLKAIECFGPCNCLSIDNCFYKEGVRCTHDTPWDFCDEYGECKVEF